MDTERDFLTYTWDDLLIHFLGITIARMFCRLNLGMNYATIRFWSCAPRRAVDENRTASGSFVPRSFQNSDAINSARYCGSWRVTIDAVTDDMLRSGQWKRRYFWEKSLGVFLRNQYIEGGMRARRWWPPLKVREILVVSLHTSSLMVEHFELKSYQNNSPIQII